MEGDTTMAGTSTSATDPAGNAAENNGGDPNGTAASATAAVSTPGTAQAEKTFTQADLDAQIKARLDREHKKLPAKEELEAFRKWQDGQKTADQKHADEVKRLQEAQTTAEKRAYELEAKYTAVSKGVRPDAAEDAIALALGKVSDSVTLEQAIDVVIAKYPSFKGVTLEQPGTTGVRGSNNQPGTLTDDAAARAIMGLPPRK